MTTDFEKTSPEPGLVAENMLPFTFATATPSNFDNLVPECILLLLFSCNSPIHFAG